MPDGEISLDDWVALGGEATLNSYGVDIQTLRRQYSRQKKLDTFIRTWLPDDLIRFLRRLPILLDTPEVLFVHAGIDPERPIAAQADDDLVFIRSRFLRQRAAAAEADYSRPYAPVRRSRRRMAASAHI